MVAMAFCAAGKELRGLKPQQKKCHSGLMLMELTGLTMFSTILK